jgi:hypothetical protein
MIEAKIFVQRLFNQRRIDFWPYTSKRKGACLKGSGYVKWNICLTVGVPPEALSSFLLLTARLSLPT